MDREKLIEYNEILKRRALTNTEWDEIKEIIERNRNNQSFILEELCPLVAVRFNGGQSSYELFLKIMCKVLNDDPKHILIGNGIIARVEKNELGDGGGAYIAFVMGDVIIGAMSAIEEYTEFINDRLVFNEIRDQILRNFL